MQRAYAAAWSRIYKEKHKHFRMATKKNRHCWHECTWLQSHDCKTLRLSWQVPQRRYPPYLRWWSLHVRRTPWPGLPTTKGLVHAFSLELSKSGHGQYRITAPSVWLCDNMHQLGWHTCWLLERRLRCNGLSWWWHPGDETQVCTRFHIRVSPRIWIPVSPAWYLPDPTSPVTPLAAP